MSEVIVAALYKFVLLPDYRAIREPLLKVCTDLGVKGTLLLAHEGINGTIAGSRESINEVLNYLRRDTRLSDIEHKESVDSGQPFYRMKVKLKKEIVTMGVEGIDPNKVVGTYVSSHQWNELISDQDVVVIDTRNNYEYQLGSFKGAVNPNTETFREFPAFVERTLNPEQHKKVAMFCTGGIRCEKSTAYLKEQGFEEVYHLQGGILKYLEDVKSADSLWEGECFVFDNRVTVDHNLEPGNFSLCHGCRNPISEADKLSEKYIAGVSCPHCHDLLTDDQRSRFMERQRQIELAKTRNEQHIGAAPPKRQRRAV